MTYTFNTKDWGWLMAYWQTCTLELEDNSTKEGWKLNDINDVVRYLTVWRFADDYVYATFIEDAVYYCATELGCVYHDVYELENDIREYYI